MKLATSLVLLLVLRFSGTSQFAPVYAASDSVNSLVICRVMEAFEDQHLGVRAIIFHQRDKADGSRLGSLLLANSGRQMELAISSGQRYRATVFRVKSAFGRGLVLLPSSKLGLEKGDEFTLSPVAD